MDITIKCAIVAVLGQIFAVLMNIYNAKLKAKAANLIFKWQDYFIEDWPRILSVFCIIIIGLIFLPYAPATTNPLILLSLAMVVGYAGTDVALRFLSSVNKRLNSAIDFKTNIADASTGNMGAPTPALKDPPKPTTTPPNP